MGISYACKRAKDDFCSGATVGSEQQHNQDLREIYKVEQILEFITFYQNALCCEQLKWACIDLCGKFSTARLGLAKFKTRRSLSDEYDG